MLTRLEVDGFKSFERLSIDLAPFTAVVGNNAAGKSNLFDVIQLLSNLASKGVAEALKELRGEPLELFRRTSSGQVRTINLAAEMLIDPTAKDPWGKEVGLKHTRLRYEVSLERRESKSGLARVEVVREAAYPIAKSLDEWVKSLRAHRTFKTAHLKYGRQKPLLTTEEKGGEMSFAIHMDGRQGRNRPFIAAEATVLSSFTDAEFLHLFALREEMRHWRLLQLDPALLRKPAPETSSDVMSPDGSNLAAVLARLKAETAEAERPDGVLSDIASELNQLIPGTSRLDAVLNKAAGEYRVELTMREGIPFSSRVISDGTLRVLALLTLLHDPRHRGLICFEEPENGVHPGRVKKLVGRLSDMVTNATLDMGDGIPAPLAQLLLNSHSPVVLSALLDQNLHAAVGSVMFADSTAITTPGHGGTRRKTRLRAVRDAKQLPLLASPVEGTESFVSDYEVRSVLDTATAEG